MAAIATTRGVCAVSEGRTTKGFLNVFDPIGGDRPPSTGAAHTKPLFPKNKNRLIKYCSGYLKESKSSS